jgi:hypothetical protein
MDVRICEMKCTLKEECGEFKAHGKSELCEKTASTDTEAVRLEAA